MNYPPIFPAVAADSACTALLGTNPTRFWAYGMAPENETRPYAVHRLISGDPNNALSCTPDCDNLTLQFNCYGRTDAEATSIMLAIRDVVETMGYITGWLNDGIDPDTRLFNKGFFADFIINR